MEFARRNSVFLIVLVLYFCSTLFMIDRYPRVWVDEPWESITAYTLEHDGRLYNPALTGRDGYGEHFLEPRLLLSFVVAPFFAAFGVGVVQGRLALVLVGALLLLAGYIFGKRLFSKRAGILISLFLWIETMIFISARTIRPEIYLAALQMFSMYFLFSAWETGELKKYFYSGLFLGVALWTHPNAILYLLAVVIIFIVEKWLSVVKSKEFWILTIGAIIAFSPYAIYVITVDAHTGFATWWSQLAGRPGEIVQSGWLISTLVGEWQRVLDYMQFPFRLPILLIYIFAIIEGIRSGNKNVKFLMIIIVVEFLLSMAIISNKSTLYATTFLPFVIVLLAKYLDDALPHSSKGIGSASLSSNHRGRSSLLAISILGVFVLNQVIGDAYLLYKNRRCSYSQVVSEFHRVIPPDARVWGSMSFWFAFYNQPYRTQYTFLKDLDSFKPQYMITGDTEVWGKPVWKRLRDDADSVVAVRGRLVREIPTECYGDLRIYEMSW